MSGIYLIISVSIDRLILVLRSKDMKITSRMRKKRRLITWIVIFLIFLFCFIFTLPNWFLYRSTLVELNLTLSDLSSNFPYSYINNQTSTMFKLSYYKNEFTQFGKRTFTMNLLNVYLYIPFVFAIPILVLIIVNLLIICELVKISARKRQLGSGAHIDRQITIIIVMIVLLFLVCQVPLAFSHIFIAYKPQMMFDKTFFYYHSFTNFLACIYLSANFVLFCFFGQEFRDTIQFMFFFKTELPYYSKNEYKRRFTFQSFYQSISVRNRAPSEDITRKLKSKNRAMSLRVEMENHLNMEDINQETNRDTSLNKSNLNSVRFKELSKSDSNINSSS
jgi:hypothetical protein